VDEKRKRIAALTMRLTDNASQEQTPRRDARPQHRQARGKTPRPATQPAMGGAMAAAFAKLKA